jgi:adenine-specific DNA-methyltransferase
MEKLKMHSTNLTQDNIARVRDLFPGCVTETKGADGAAKLAVDFDQLRQELSESMVEGPQERYNLNWPGKREALFTANAPIAKTLRPYRNESVDFDTTKNLFIEGDNLDALKLLQDTYLGKVKMIYIDPPYNTGNDFIYEDDFSESADAYIARSLQKDEIGNRLTANTESNGRFHSDWLSMIYPRIRLARNLLRDDGVIFISIDDNEVHNLRKICDETFGESNLIAQICHKARASISNDKIISSNHNHILWYAKSLDSVFAKRSEIGLDPDLSGFSNPDNDPRGAWKVAPVDGPGGAKKGNPFYEFLGVEGYFRYSKETMQKKHQDGLIIKTSNGLQQKYFLSQAEKSRKTDNTWWDDAGLTSSATRALQQMMGGKTFDTPKPVELISRMLELMTFGRENDALVMDFFAGSATTAQAVMQANAKDGGSRRFILVQLPEVCDQKSDAHKSGYKTISEISMERIRRAGLAVRSQNKFGAMTDIGFRLLKIDNSNMADVYYTPDAIERKSLDLFIDNIKSDRTAEDLLFQVMLDWGVDLSLPLVKQSIQGKEVFFIDGNSLAACFDASGSIDEAFVKELAKQQPLRVVFRDAGFKDSAVKINVEQIFKLLSSATEVKCI